MSVDWKSVADPASSEIEEDIAVASIDDAVFVGEGVFDADDWKREMVNDHTLLEVVKLLKSGPKRESCLPVSVWPYNKILDELSLGGDGVLIKGEKFIPLFGIRRKLLALAHEGHLGQTLTQRRLKNHFW